MYSYALLSPTGYLFPVIRSPKHPLKRSRITFDSVHRERGSAFSWWCSDPSIALPLLQLCKQVHDFFFDRQQFDKVVSKLYSSCHGKHQYWGTVRRIMELQVDSWSVRGAARRDPNAILALLHDSIGGELWVN